MIRERGVFGQLILALAGFGSHCQNSQQTGDDAIVFSLLIQPSTIFDKHCLSTDTHQVRIFVTHELVTRSLST